MKQALRKFFTDKQGKVVIAQVPNVWLIGWAIFLGLSMLVKHGATHAILSGISTAFIIVWAVLEVLKGASPFRRCLGAVVLALTLISLVTKFF